MLVNKPQVEYWTYCYFEQREKSFQRAKIKLAYPVYAQAN